MIDGLIDLVWQLIFTSSGTVNPWLVLVLFFAPLIGLAAWKRTFPHVPLAIVLAAPVALTLCIPFFPDIVWFVLCVDAAILGVTAFDLITMPGRKSFSAERDVMRIASIRQNHRVTLTVTNHSNRTYQVWVKDDVPHEFTASPGEFMIRMPPRSRTTMHYEIKPSRRGAFELRKVYLRARTLLGLWQSYVDLPVESIINVYPDMKQLAEYAVLARTNRLSLMGVRRTRKIGQDNEFERLRDYTRDDNYKQIEWRATARRRKLTVKDYQTNQSQRIIFLLDCGRMMTNEAAGLSLLDHSLNAMLMMSYVALRQGDAVGLVCFSDQVHVFVPPRSGMKQMNHLLHASFDRFPDLVESRYDQAFLYLRTHCPKRALVVLVTNIIDEVNSMQVEQYLGSLVGRHLPLGVLLRDHQLFDAADETPRSAEQLFRAAAAADILTWRHQVLTDLEHTGVLTIDAFPEHLTAPMINRYLEIKARHLL